jgi:hypothetical protein
MDSYLKRLEESGMSLMVYKEGALVFQSAGKGISPHLEAWERLGAGLRGTIMADKIVGRAAAFMVVHSGAAEIHAAVLSRPGIEVLERYRVSYVAGGVVDNVLTVDGKIFCPFESMVQGIDDADVAFEAIVRKMHELRG